MSDRESLELEARELETDRRRLGLRYAPVGHYEFPSDEEPEVEAPACASCLEPLAEGDAFDVRCDQVCPACAAEWAMEILAAEAHPDWTPTRDLSERFRALEIVKLLLPRWEKRIRADEAKRLGGRA